MKLTEDEVKTIVWEDHPIYEVVESETDYSTLYKDYAHTDVIFKDTDTGKHYRIFYASYESHYGSGESMYDAQEAVEVELVERVITKTIKSWEIVNE